MIAIILGITAIIILTRLVKKENKYKEDDWFARSERRFAIFMSCLIALIIDVTVWGIYNHTAIETAQTTEIVTSVNLVTLQDNSSTTGRFFLGSGSLSNKNYYAFYYKTEHGYKYQTIDAESSSTPVYIKYISAGETPHMDQYALVERKTMSSNGSKSWLFSVMAWLQYGQYSAGDLISEETTNPALFAAAEGPDYYDNWRCEIHIPEGSIKTDYVIDME